MRALTTTLRLAERCLRAVATNLDVPVRLRLRTRRCADAVAAAIREAGGKPSFNNNGNGQ